MRVGRNEACPCGSGKKFKACCEGKQTRGVSRGLIALLGAIGIVAAVGMVAAIRDNNDESKTTARPAATARNTTPKPQPPGPVPAGKVWSAEHGHWHDAAPRRGGTPAGNAGGNTTQPPIQISGAKAPPKPQPPGPAPAGKVWSPEHGHWHDAK